MFSSHFITYNNMVFLSLVVTLHSLQLFNSTQNKADDGSTRHSILGCVVLDTQDSSPDFCRLVLWMRLFGEIIWFTKQKPNKYSLSDQRGNVMVQFLLYNFGERYEQKFLFRISFPIFMRQLIEKLTFDSLATLIVVEDLKDCIPIWSSDGNFLKL